jgi:hypothetical protein
MMCLPKSTFCAHSLKSRDRVQNALESLFWRRLSGDWQLGEDSPYKPGWIATKPGSTIEFDLSFGALPKLALTYLMGPAKGLKGKHLCPVTVGFKPSAADKVDPFRTFVLNPERDSVSITQYETLSLPPRVLEYMGVKKYAAANQLEFALLS